MAFNLRFGKGNNPKTGHGLPSALKQTTEGPGKKKPLTRGAVQGINDTGKGNIGGPGPSTGMYNYNRRPKMAENEYMQDNDVSYEASKKYAKAHNAMTENEVRWNTERQAKMDSTNTANYAKYSGLKTSEARKLGNIAANKTRKELGGANMPTVDRYTANGFMTSDETPAYSADVYKRNKSFEVKFNAADLVPEKKSPMKQRVSKKTAYDIKEASNQKLKPSARKHYAENAQAAMKNKKKK